MYYIDSESTTILEIKKSKFISYMTPYNKFDLLMKTLKQNHPKARHFVYAYRYLNEFDQIVENSSDDGEPKGTSGRPALSVLSGAGMINTAVIIVRYFGGIRLGTGGLVKAYSDAVNLVLESAHSIAYVKLYLKKLTLQYAELSQIEYLLSKYPITIQNKTFSDIITLDLEGTQEDFLEISNHLFLGNTLEDIL